MRHPLYPNPALPLADHPPAVLLAMCLFGEGRGETEQTRRAIAQVIVNRARYPHAVFGSQRGLPFHENVVQVILKPCQFSCFLSSDVNYHQLLDPLAHDSSGIWTECLQLATEYMKQPQSPDTLTFNSDHYFDDSIQTPSWADPAKATVTIGRLRFFRLYLPALQSGAGTATPSGAGQTASLPPSLSASSSAAAPAADEAYQMSLPATPPPNIRESRYGLTRWLGGRELSSLQGAGDQRSGPAAPAIEGVNKAGA